MRLRRRTAMTMSRSLVALAMYSLLPVGCNGDAEPPRPALDLVFVIENAGSMLEEQHQIARDFPRLLAELRDRDQALPDLHIAVLSSDVGAGTTTVGTCTPGGQRGVFQLQPDCGPDPLLSRERFLSVDEETGRNFTGDLATAFACTAQLGTLGCGYEHHLESLRLGLTPTNDENRGFLRPNAALGIVFLAEEDDCSADPSAGLFEGFVASQAPSLRCSLRGHACGGTPVPAQAGFTAPLSSCTALERPAGEDLRDRLINVSEYVAAIKALKPGHEDRIAVAAIIGWDDAPTATYRIVKESNGVELGVICQANSTGNAWPAVRLHAFATAFARHTVHSSCGDLGETMAAVGRLLRP